MIIILLFIYKDNTCMDDLNYIYNSKYTYLESKLEVKEECISFCKEYNDIYKKNIRCCNICFYKNVILPYDRIPECSTCLRDMENFKNKLNTDHDQQIIKLQSECCIHCLWWDWFDKKRRDTLSNLNKKLEYVKKIDPKPASNNLSGSNKDNEVVNKNDKHHKHNKNSKHNKKK